MNDDNKSYRTTRRPLEVDKASTFTKGWYRSLTEKVGQLENAINGLKGRVNSVKNNRYTEYQEMMGVPASYRRDFQIKPDAQILQFHPAFYDANPRNFPNPYPITVPETNQPVNFIVRSGQIYDIDVQFPGDGVFVAEFLSVQIYQRHFNPNVGVVQIKMNIPEGRPYLNDGAAAASLPVTAENQRFCINVPDVAANPARPNRKLEWFWNITERRSGRKFADDFLSCRFLLNQTPRFLTSVKDGDVFRLGKPPWIFERDSQVQFHFLPIQDVFQLDPSSPILPYGYNDRENGNTVRDCTVTVRVEFHGAKFLTSQDAFKYGAVLDRRDYG